VLIRVALTLFSHDFKENILRLFPNVLTYSSSMKPNGVALGSPPSLMIASFFMEDSEQAVLDRVIQ
jgi:hypothetical protein